MGSALQISEVQIAGHARPLGLRLYAPYAQGAVLPIVLYFHGGGFVGGTLDDADVAASFIASHARLMVISVDYSLAPAHPFPAAPEDGYRAALWALGYAGASTRTAPLLGVAGHDAGGNLAASLTLMARDRGSFAFAAQALLAPLLDPSMTRLGDESEISSDVKLNHCAQCYRAYLPHASQRSHPYAAPLESSRLAGLPPALIASAQNDVLHVEAERYAGALIAAGVPTQVTRHVNASHAGLAAHPAALADVSTFLQLRLGAAVAPADNNFASREF
jgi:acetyl esterase